MSEDVKIFVVVEKNWDNFEPDHIYPFFYYTEEDAINNIKARAIAQAVRFNVPDEHKEFEGDYGVQTFLLAKDATTRTTADEWNNRNRIS